MTDLPEAPSAPAAPLSRRLLAFVIDLTMVNLAYGLLLMAALAGLSLGLQQVHRSLPSQDLILSLSQYGVAAWSLLFIGYFWYFTAMGGQTPGKQFTRLRVVTTADGPVHWLPALWRTIALYLSLPLFIVFAMATLTPQKRALHDCLAGTRVILGTMIAAFLLLAPLAGSSRAVVVDQLLAVVNGQTIALSDLVRYRLLFAPELPPEQLLERLIDHLVVLDEASRFELAHPDPGRIRETVRQLERSFGSAAQWDTILKLARLTPSELDQLVANRLRVEAFLNQLVDLFIFVSPSDVEAAYEQEVERFNGQPLEAVEQTIEQELLRQKIAEKRQDYVARLRARATIRQLAEAPDALPPRP